MEYLKFVLFAFFLPNIIVGEPHKLSGLGKKLGGVFKHAPKLLDKIKKHMFVKDRFPLEDFKQDGDGVPAFVNDIVSQIEERGLQSKYIYKEDADSYLVEKVSNSIIHNEVVNFEDKDVYLLGATLKHTLYRHLEYPLFGDQRETFTKGDTSILISAIKELPESRKNTIVKLLGHMKSVIHHKKENDMSASDLAKQWVLPFFFSNTKPSGSNEISYLRNAITMMLDLTAKQLKNLNEKE